MQIKNMHSRFYKLLIIVFLSCGKLFSQEGGELLDSTQLEEVYTFMDIKEALEHPEMVIRLELKKQKLKTFPKEIFQFKNLQYLDLSKNQLKELPDSIYLLTKLQCLNVSHNKLGSFPKEIGKCKNLFYLNANNNNLYGLPPQIGNLEKLRTLDLWSNDLADFPEELSNLKQLNTLDLRAILISDDNTKLLKKWLPNTNIFLSPACNCKL
jgi:Leucine-rich repeat (LRR) protein